MVRAILSLSGLKLFVGGHLVELATVFTESQYAIFQQLIQAQFFYVNTLAQMGCPSLFSSSHQPGNDI